MAVSEETPIATSVANGVTTSFPHSFTVLDDGDFVATGLLPGATSSTPYVLGVDYTISGVGNPTGSITFASAPPSGTIVTRYRKTALARLIQYQDNGDLLAGTVNLDFNRVWYALQEILTGGQAPAGAIRVPAGEVVDELPQPALRANKTLTFDASGNPVVTTPAAGTATALAADLLDYLMPNKGAGMSGYSPSVQYPAFSVGAMFGKRVLVDVFGASPTASAAANVAAFNAAKAALGNKGGVIEFGRGKYQFNEELTIDVVDVVLVGQGTGTFHVPTSPAATPGATILEFTHTSGGCIRIAKDGCTLRDLMIAADATRQAASYSVDNFGVRVEAADTPGGTCSRTYIDRCHVQWQPGDGIQMISLLVNSAVVMTDIDMIKGHGIVIDGGAYTGRTNVARPGQIDLLSLRISRTDGNAVRVGNIDTDLVVPTQRPYRINLHNLECFHNRKNPALFPDPYCWYLHGENIIATMSATGGETANGFSGHSGIYIAGQNIWINNHRFIDCEPHCVYIGNIGASATSRNIRIDSPYINNENQPAGYYNPAVYISPGAQNTQIIYQGRSSDIGTLFNDDATHFYTTVEETYYRRFNGTHISNFRSNQSAINIPDNKAAYVTFSNVARGVLVVSGNVAGSGAANVHFRVGDGNAHATLIGATANAESFGSPGTLTGTTGADTKLTFRADSATNRLYIENRLGGQNTYNITLLSANVEVESVTVLP